MQTDLSTMGAANLADDRQPQTGAVGARREERLENARHDVARRIDCGFLAQLVAEHRMEEWEAAELAVDLSYNLAKAAYKL